MVTSRRCGSPAMCRDCRTHYTSAFYRCSNSKSKSVGNAQGMSAGRPPGVPWACAGRRRVVRGFLSLFDQPAVPSGERAEPMTARIPGVNHRPLEVQSRKMKPIFSVHAGEYLTGSHIEKNFRHVNLWVPAKDRGIDLLVSDSANHDTVSLQVKFSKDFLVAHMQRQAPEFQRRLRACGWWTLNSEKVRRSPADYWVFVLQGFANKSVDYVVIPPRELLRRLHGIHHGRQKLWQVYLWVTKTDRCWETRDLSKGDKLLIADDKFSNPRRDFSKYLDAWKPVERLNKA